MERALKVTDLKVIQMPYRSEIYYEFEWPEYSNILRGFKLGVTFEEDSYIEFYENCEQWYDLTWTWTIYNSEGGSVNCYDCTIGEYEAVLSVGASNVTCSIPFSVVSPDRMNELSIDSPLTNQLGSDDYYTENWAKVEIEEAGIYKFVMSEFGNLYLYENAYSVLSSAFESMIYTFAEPKIYYLTTAVWGKDYSVTMESDSAC